MLGSLTIIDIVVLIAVILVSLTIHEMVHAFVGYKLGDNTARLAGRISLNPLQHIDPVMTVLLPVITVVAFGAPILAAKPVPFDPDNVKWDEFGAAIIAAAGPVSNLILAALGVILANAVVTNTALTTVLYTFVTVNVSLFVFNLIPIPPLDGSRVLYAFAPDPLRRLMEQIEPYGFFIVFGLLILPGIGLGAMLNTWIQAVFHALPLNPFIG